MTAFPDTSLLPVPKDFSYGEGYLRLEGEIRIALTGVRESRIAHAAERFAQYIRQRTGLSVSLASGKTGRALVVVTVAEESTAEPGTPENESYTLTVSRSDVLLEASKVYGVLHGFQTLQQLIVPTPDGYRVPVVRIVDQPRFGWRGLLLDAVRHWLPVEVIKRNLDAMAAVKLNVLHWHLTNDQGFRIESRRFPRLHEMGSDGQFYRQDEVRDILDCAWQRGIRVVPEFSMPGHATSWFVGHPELASAPGPYAISDTFGGHEATMDTTLEGTLELLREFLSEMISLFPGRFIHLGGDQIDPKAWGSNAAIRARMQGDGFQDPHDLLVGFHNTIHAFLRDHGRESISWDPLVAAELDPGILVQSVRGQAWVARAVRGGHRAIASSEYYLDAMLPASHYYLRDPLDDEVSSVTNEQCGNVLGAEASMWTEFATADNIDSRTWPRAAAVAERLWSPREIGDVDDLYRRLRVVSDHLDAIGLTHQSGPRRMLRVLAGGAPSSAVEVLADVVAPITLEARWKLLAQYTTSTPLNRMVDAAVPDGETPRAFVAQVAAFVADPSHEATYRQLEADLQAWADNHERFGNVVARSALLTEVIPISEALSESARVGLACLRALHTGRSFTSEGHEAQRAVLASASAPMAELTLAVLPGILALLQAVPENRARATSRR